MATDCETIASERRPRGRPTALADEARSADLLRVAAEQFERLGYAGTSISQIARLSRISKTTIYARYGDKAALFRAICSYACRVPADRFRAVRTHGRPPRAVLADFAAAVREGMSDRAAVDFLRLAIFEANRFPDVAAAIWEEGRATYQPLKTYLDHLLQKELLHGDTDMLADQFVSLVSGGYQGLLQAGAGPEAEKEAALNLFLRGTGLS